MIIELEFEMKDAADKLDFKKAIYLHNRINKLKQNIY